MALRKTGDTMRGMDRNSKFPAVRLCALALSGFVLSIPAHAQPSVAGPQEPPLCNEKQTLKDLRKGYDFLESQGEGLKLKEVTDVKQLYLQAPPASVNQYANSKHYGVKSRYCEAVGQLSNGKTDPLYWRMDYLVDGPGHSINFDSCSLRHDLLDPKCRKIRDGK
jgi:hypothetical protein